MKSTTFELLATDFATAYPQEASRALAELPAAHTARFLETCSPELASSIGRQLTALELVACVRHMRVDQAAAMLSEMPVEKAATILRSLHDATRDALADAFPRDRRRRLEALLAHPPGTAGAMMEPLVFTTGPGRTAGEVLESLARHAERLRYYVYVVDEPNFLGWSASCSSTCCWTFLGVSPSSGSPATRRSTRASSGPGSPVGSSCGPWSRSSLIGSSIVRS